MLNELTAIILCGGRGERLRPLTEKVPKPLIPVRGQPILQHILDHLCRYGINKSVLCIGYKASMLRSYAANRHATGCRIECIDSGDVSMNDRVLDTLAVASGPVLICYGDTLANVDLHELEASHRRAGSLATVTVFPLRSPFGIVDIADGDVVVRMTEKPVLPYWINIGYIRCDREAFKHMKRGSDLVQFCSAVAATGSLSAYRHTGQHMTVNTEDDLPAAEKEILSFATAVTR